MEKVNPLGLIFGSAEIGYERVIRDKLILKCMKKYIFILLMVLFCAGSAQAQDFKIGVNAGLPVGEFSELDSFALQAVIAYLFEVSDRFELGPVVSAYHFFGAEVDVFTFQNSDPLDPFIRTVRTDDTTLIPIGGTARFAITESLILGTDLGYAFFTRSGVGDGGFYFKPQVLYMIGDNFGIKVSYSGVKVDSFTFSSVNLGVEFGF